VLHAFLTSLSNAKLVSDNQDTIKNRIKTRPAGIIEAAITKLFSIHAFLLLKKKKKKKCLYRPEIVATAGYLNWLRSEMV